MASRRSLLASALAGSVVSTGCLSDSSDWSNRGRGNGRNRGPVFLDNADRRGFPPFSAEIFTHPEDASARLNLHSEHYRADFLEFDPNSEFIAVFAATDPVAPPGKATTSCPAVETTDDRIVFELPIDGSLEELDSPTNYWFVLTLWELNRGDPPERAMVDIIHPDDRPDHRTCSE